MIDPVGHQPRSATCGDVPCGGNESCARVRPLPLTMPVVDLTADEAARRLKEYGTNELVERGIKNPWLILWEQITSSVVVVLMLAAVVSALLNDYKDALAIIAIIVLNAALGFSQEYRAEKAIAA